MIKVLKNLKSSFITIIFIVALLCLQAWTDLALPDYTSKIVNIGIQSGGIDNAVPNLISKKDMDLMLSFSQENNRILDYYTISTEETTEEQNKIIKKYLGENEKQKEFYIIKTDLNNDQIKELSEQIQTPLIQVSFLTNQENSEKIKEEIIKNIPEEQKEVVKNQSLEEILGIMPQEQKNVIMQQLIEQLNNIEDSVKEQAAISAVKQVYKNLNIDTDKIQNDYILLTGMQMLGIALVSMTAAVTIMLLSSRVAAKLGKTLREKVFKKVLSFSSKELREFSTASLITRSTNDIQQIQQLITMLFRVVVYAPIIGIGGFIKVLTTSNNSMAWVIGVAILGILFIVGTLFIIAMPKFKKLQDLLDKLNQVAREILTGLPVIRAFNQEKKEEQRFDNANIDLMKTNIFVNRAMSMMMPMLTFVMNSIMLLIIWVGGHSVSEGVMQVGDMMAFIQYTMQIVMSFLMISMISIMLPRASVSAKRIVEVLETENDIKDKTETKKLNPDKKGLVEFKNVSFRYPDADTEILEDITFTAKPGQTTAIIGSTGSGKSTIVNLIPRFYDTTSGELLINGENVKDLSQKD